MDSSTILDEVRSWPADEQFELVSRLWDQLIESGWQPEVTDELKAELDRRLAAHAADPSRVVTWEQIVARVREKR